MTSPMSTARAAHTATLLPNGKVLVAGGDNIPYNYPFSAELYDPVTGTWTTTGSLNTPRDFHTATLLTNGQVLVAGGFCYGLGVLASAELYDPASGTWTTTGSLNNAREFHAATLLTNGLVLVEGGGLSSAEMYDSASGTVLPICLTNALMLSDGACQFTFSNTPGLGFTIVAATNPALPLRNWTALGSATEVAPGQFQFIDSQATNTARRFYRVRSP